MDDMLLYPMGLSAICRSAIWGGNRMRDVFGIQTNINNIAEAWMLSARMDMPSFVVNGEHMGEMFPMLLSAHPEWIAKDATADTHFPLLIKFIDARDTLSIQVHPDDAYAGKGNGKTELWVVLEASPMASIMLDTKSVLSGEALQAAIDNGTVASEMKVVSVKAGDVFYLPAGMLHAIGGGVLLAEIQENSDVTYRVTDFGRMGEDGTPRPLHIADAVAVAKHYTEEEIEALRYAGERNEHTLANTARFSVEDHTVSEKEVFSVGDRFVSLLVLSGRGVLVHNGETYPVSAGECYFLPAGMGEYSLAGLPQMRVLLSTANQI